MSPTPGSMRECPPSPPGSTSCPPTPEARECPPPWKHGMSPDLPPPPPAASNQPPWVSFSGGRVILCHRASCKTWVDLLLGPGWWKVYSRERQGPMEEFLTSSNAAAQTAVPVLGPWLAFPSPVCILKLLSCGPALCDLMDLVPLSAWIPPYEYWSGCHLFPWDLFTRD